LENSNICGENEESFTKEEIFSFMKRNKIALLNLHVLLNKSFKIIHSISALLLKIINNINKKGKYCA